MRLPLNQKSNNTIKVDNNLIECHVGVKQQVKLNYMPEAFRHRRDEILRAFRYCPFNGKHVTTQLK